MSTNRLAARIGVVTAVLSSVPELASPRGVSAGEASRAWVLDSGSRALVGVALPSGERLGSLAVSGSPSGLAQSPEGSWLVVFDRGPGEDKRERGYKATGKSSATIVKPASLQEVGRVELGHGLGRWAFSPDGAHLFVFARATRPRTQPRRSLQSSSASTSPRRGRRAG